MLTGNSGKPRLLNEPGGANRLKHELSKHEVLASTPSTTGGKKAKPSLGFLSVFL